MTASKHMGQPFDQFLQEEGIYEEVQLMALKKTISHQIRVLMDKENIKKAELARKMGTSRSSLERLLSDESSNITLHTINKAALVLGKRLDISLVDLHPEEAQH
ncbi:transcriptional regulator, XRE family [Desulfonatronospira thiodismutans ASO3-1]|uniref:Transcriptional regulator, XRE family n=1 Tax=Desulfonatronospira thiodismutans ASO3-1 TaxID=555779 RepID=D6ST65_9BACT|nr:MULTISPECIES: helix-turn-helix transcriptional regulator [Desulfonatronospira]EFI33881.1 transcriptional regulator, XRE family [Desulfonatronospira thiodismutans ASO3-1]RQD78583.1 MAG: XRE family transcriptional regulator [Desulfonatronospira sp. MSAO_Bac3]